MKTLSRISDKNELLERLKKISPESRRRWGRMNAHQMICHLSDAFRLALGEKPAKFNGNLLERFIIKYFAIYTPVPWPRGYKPGPEMDQLAGGTQPVEFRRDMNDLKLLMDRFAQNIEFNAWHPVFGKLSEDEWKRWGYRHVNHHLRQFGV